MIEESKEPLQLLRHPVALPHGGRLLLLLPFGLFQINNFFGGNLHKLLLLTYHHYIHHHNTDQLSSALLPTKNIQREKETVSGGSKLKVCRSKTKKKCFSIVSSTWRP